MEMRLNSVNITHSGLIKLKQRGPRIHSRGKGDIMELILQKRAEKAAEFRGHDLTMWQRHDKGMVAFCEFCGKRVDVIFKPQPNEIDIGGEVVALGCDVNLESVKGGK